VGLEWQKSISDPISRSGDVIFVVEIDMSLHLFALLLVLLLKHLLFQAAFDSELLFALLVLKSKFFILRSVLSSELLFVLSVLLI
jgi:hypothetical protein